MASREPPPDIPELDLKFPDSPLALEAFAFSREHAPAFVHNHTVRTAYWALIFAKKLPEFTNAALDLEVLVVSAILHDMGWARSKHLLSQDKRFEVDGANIARDLIRRHAPDWDANRAQRAWDAIAFHTSSSLARYGAPEVALVNLAVLADFAGPNFKGAPVTLQEYRALTAVFPREGFTSEGLKGVLCGICRDKPSTTYDNWVGSFGLEFGLDGNGGGKEEYAKAWREGQAAAKLVPWLDALSPPKRDEAK